LKDKKFEQALKQLMLAQSICGEKAKVYLDLADCCKNLSRFDEMLAYAEKAEFLSSDNYKSHLLLGEALVEVGKRE